MNAGVDWDTEYVVFDRWPDHTPRTIFATLFKSDDSQEIVAFRVSGGGDLRRLATYGEAEIHNVELKDVTGDGSPELLVTSSLGNRSAEVDILQWTGRTFDKIGETSDHASFIDIDGDGVPEIVEAVDSGMNECDARAGMTYVEKLKHGHFEKDPYPDLINVDAWTKRTGRSETLGLHWFLPDDVPTKCRLRVRTEGVTALRLTMHEVDSDAGSRTLALHDGVHAIALPSRCTQAELTVTGRRGATVVLLLESR